MKHVQILHKNENHIQTWEKDRKIFLFDESVRMSAIFFKKKKS